MEEIPTVTLANMGLPDLVVVHNLVFEHFEKLQKREENSFHQLTELSETLINLLKIKLGFTARWKDAAPNMIILIDNDHLTKSMDAMKSDVEIMKSANKAYELIDLICDQTQKNIFDVPVNEEDTDYGVIDFKEE